MGIHSSADYDINGVELFLGQGQLVNPFLFTSEDILVGELAQTLSRINRFTGNGIAPVSVAQHCVNLSYLVPEHLAKAALLHDMCEVFIGDVPSPIKAICPQINEIEDRILRRVAHVFGIPFIQFLEVKPFDKAIARDEARMMFPQADPDLVDPKRGLGIEVVSMTQERAAEEWVRRFFQLFMEDHYGW